MISELFIESYRGLHNLKLDSLGKVNIIAGANNTGKTSILEVIKSLEAPNDLLAWRVIGRREGNAFRVSATVYDSMKSLFPMNCDKNSAVIAYSGKYDNEPFSVELTAEMADGVLAEEQVRGLNTRFFIGENEEYEPQEYETSILRVNYEVNGVNCGKDEVYSIQTGMHQQERENAGIVENVVYISPTQHAQNSFYLSSLMTNPDLYEQFVEIMKEFDSDFVSINSVVEERTHVRKYVVLSKKFNEGLLLNAYGDGMKKAMLLLSAVLKAKNGVLLLDEFETAIHISAMEKVFKWIIETAVKLNVQIFMTSHSLEAISTVLKCCPEMQQDIKMLTLVNTEDGVKVRNVDAAKAIQLMDEYGLELR